MADFAVSEEKNRWLKNRMELLGVSEEDLEERFVHASGRGGQHVNKSSSCVYLKHLPTGVEVKCMESRSQSLNRFLARRYLLEKVEALSGKLTKKDLEAEKLRKQKARRKRRSGSKYAETAGGRGDVGVAESAGAAGAAGAAGVTGAGLAAGQGAGETDGPLPEGDQA